MEGDAVNMSDMTGEDRRWAQSSAQIWPEPAQLPTDLYDSAHSLQR